MTYLRKFVLLLALTCFAGSAQTQPFREVADQVRTESYPELSDSVIELLPMRSEYIYLKSRFKFTSFFLAPKLSYQIRVNTQALDRHVPPEALRAIMSHELAHVDYYHQRHRLALLGLVRLLSSRFTVRFERGADLEAIALGYGPGLAAYRNWLYQNIPSGRVAAKKRDYLTPEEIETIVQAVRINPGLLQVFRHCVPRNLAEVQAGASNPTAACSH